MENFRIMLLYSSIIIRIIMDDENGQVEGKISGMNRKDSYVITVHIL